MNVKTAHMNTGEDIIFTLVEEKEDTIVIDNVLVAGPSATGQIGFGPWAPLIEEGEPIEVKREFLVFVANPRTEVADNYKKIFSKIETPSKKLIL